MQGPQALPRPAGKPWQHHAGKPQHVWLGRPGPASKLQLQARCMHKPRVARSSERCAFAARSSERCAFARTLRIRQQRSTPPAKMTICKLSFQNFKKLLQAVFLGQVVNGANDIDGSNSVCPQIQQTVVGPNCSWPQRLCIILPCSGSHHN